jgi:hypothetical protein
MALPVLMSAPNSSEAWDFYGTTETIRRHLPATQRPRGGVSGQQRRSDWGPRGCERQGRGGEGGELAECCEVLQVWYCLMPRAERASWKTLLFERADCCTTQLGNELTSPATTLSSNHPQDPSAASLRKHTCAFASASLTQSTEHEQWCPHEKCR